MDPVTRIQGVEVSKITIIVYAETAYIGSRATAEIEVDKDEWEAMSEEEREDFVADTQSELIETGYYVEGEE